MAPVYNHKHWTIWDNIILIVALDSLHNDFEMTIIPLLHFKDKDLEKIKQIVISTKVANMAKQITGQTADLSIIA